jgi:putative heme transporter
MRPRRSRRARASSESAGAPSSSGPDGKEGHRSLLSLIPKWLRHSLVLFIGVLLVEFVVVPELVGASKHLEILAHLRPGWLVAGVVLEASSYLVYAFLTKVLLPNGGPGLGKLVRIILSTTAISHVIPAGNVGGVGLGYQLLTTNGVEGTDAGFVLATESVGSSVVLIILLSVALVISIPLAGLHPIYVAAALVALLGLFGAAALVYSFTKGEERSVRFVRALGGRVPRVGADRLERVVREVSKSIVDLWRDRRTFRRALLWSALSWLFDAASLWSFLAALGRIVDPVELFAAYGIANMLAGIPITPGGLGVIEVSTGALLVSFGVPGTIATYGVLAWRLFNYWLPIPIGAGSYLSLQVPRGSGLRARRKALSEMAAEARRPDEAHLPTNSAAIRPTGRRSPTSSSVHGKNVRDRPNSTGDRLHRS